MHEHKPFSLRGRIASFGYAISGLWQMLVTQHNAWIHLIASAVVVAAGLVYQLTSSEWILIIIALMLVWVTEAFNTSFEFLCDVASPDFHPLVEKAKNIAAGAVLISAIGAVFIGGLVFAPHLLK
jgi:diacylglycerol kinase (ATP)